MAPLFEQLVLDALDRGVDLLDAHRALAQRQRHRGAHLGRIEFGARAVLLDDRGQRDLGALVGREALVAAAGSAGAAGRRRPRRIRASRRPACLRGCRTGSACGGVASGSRLSGRPGSRASAPPPWRAPRRCWPRRCGSSSTSAIRFAVGARLVFLEAARRHRRRAEADAAGHHRLLRIVRDAVLVARHVRRPSTRLGLLAGEALGRAGRPASRGSRCGR